MLSPVHSLRDWAAERPGAPAVVGPGLVLTAGELWDTALRIAGWLHESGVRPDEAVGAAVPPGLHPAFLIGLLVHGSAGAIVAGEAEVGPDAPLQRIVVVGEPAAGVPPEAVLRFDASALAAMARIDPAGIVPAGQGLDEVVRLVHSSGTTGAPKAVMVTGRAVEAYASAPRRVRLAHSAYLSLQPGLVTGASSAFLAAMLARRPHLTAGTAEENLVLLREHSVEIAEGSPFQLDALLAAARREGERLPALRELHSTGAPLSSGLAQELADWFGVSAHDGYGSSEAGFVATRRVDGADAALGATLEPDVRAEVVDDEHRPVRQGEEGRVRIRTATIGIGYVGDPDLGPYRGFHDGWFYSGDLGRIVDGRLVILGREDELMNIAGRKVMPERVEEVLVQQPGVREAVACVVVDRLGVRQLAVAVVGEPLADPAAFAAGLRGPLGGIQPSLVARVPAIPRTATGKPQRQQVAAMLQQRMRDSGPLL